MEAQKKEEANAFVWSNIKLEMSYTFLLYKYLQANFRSLTFGAHNVLS